MKRTLFNIAAAVSLLLCIPTFVLWVLSYRGIGSLVWAKHGARYEFDADRKLGAGFHAFAVGTLVSATHDYWTRLQLLSGASGGVGFGQHLGGRSAMHRAPGAPPSRALACWRAPASDCQDSRMRSAKPAR